MGFELFFGFGPQLVETFTTLLQIITNTCAVVHITIQCNDSGEANCCLHLVKIQTSQRVFGTFRLTSYTRYLLFQLI